MKSRFLSAMILSAAALASHGAAVTAPAAVAADTIVDNVTVGRFSTGRDGSRLLLDMTLGLDDLHVGPNRCVLLQPAIVNGADSLALPQVAVYGRSRHYHYERSRGGDTLLLPGAMRFMARDMPDTVAYHNAFPYADWMDGATVSLRRIDRGCCGRELTRDYGVLGRHHERFFPELIYISPAGEREKRRALEGRAYIDFPVDRTVIYPDYRRNAAELAAIRATIDTIRNDRDARIDSVWLKGFASPESPYAHNTELAVGRTQALRDYLDRLYRFEGVAWTTDHEPEDWQGLREAVEASNLGNRDAILALIDADMDPDLKEARIKRLYPDDYRFMLTHFYPALRHTNYRVSYVIRSYNDPVEILQVMRSHPQNLSLNEFYVAASDMEPGSEPFTEVYETAVRMYPDDATANLNAANAALRRGDIAAASRYVDKAGDSPEAVYTRGAVAIRQKDYDRARRLLARAAEAGLQQAADTLAELDRRTQ